jgi:hypothetical protein
MQIIVVATDNDVIVNSEKSTLPKLTDLTSVNLVLRLRLLTAFLLPIVRQGDSRMT